MIGTSPDQYQRELFRPLLKETINLQHQLVVLLDRTPWKEIEDGFAPLYSNAGTPAKPVRLMGGLLILKQVYDLTDETVTEAWTQNSYYQYFCGEAYFQ